MVEPGAAEAQHAAEGAGDGQTGREVHRNIPGRGGRVPFEIPSRTQRERTGDFIGLIVFQGEDRRVVLQSGRQ